MRPDTAGLRRLQSPWRSPSLGAPGVTAAGRRHDKAMGYPRVRRAVSTRRSDAVSAALAGLVVWVAARLTGLTPRELLAPRPFLAGVAAAVVVEAGFARWPARAGRFWRRPAVRWGSPVLLVAATLAAARRAGAAPVAATLGGLAGYFALLVGIVAGVVPEPATWFEATGSGGSHDADAGLPDDTDAD